MAEQSKPMPTQTEFRALVQQANDGLPGAMETLRECLSDHPEIWQKVGDLSRLAMEGLIAAASEGDQLLAESLRQKVEELRQELLGEAPTKLECIAVERIVVAWFEVNYLTRLYPVATGASAAQKNAVANQKNAAERRLQNALKSLMTIRSLAAQLSALGNDRLRVVHPATA